MLEKLVPANPKRLDLVKSTLEFLETAPKLREREAGGRFELTEG